MCEHYWEIFTERRLERFTSDVHITGRNLLCWQGWLKFWSAKHLSPQEHLSHFYSCCLEKAASSFLSIRGYRVNTERKLYIRSMTKKKADSIINEFIDTIRNSTETLRARRDYTTSQRLSHKSESSHKKLYKGSCDVTLHVNTGHLFCLICDD